MPPDFSCSLCSPYLLLLLLLQAGRVDGLKCYTGDSFSRVADVPVMTCNSSLESQCQFVCERMEFTNSTDGSLIVIDVCRYGCASAAQCQQYTSFNGGMFDVQRVCDCSWSTDDAFWTKYNLNGQGPKFCCPTCYLGLSYSPQRCPSALVSKESAMSSEPERAACRA
mmetsp:Transcript_48442/g.151920  ORF Transcript_48442/g.151920 Transcript_48442/m.151920 type:complete len:167 (-) Transcript_48442:1556-2056(-)